MHRYFRVDPGPLTALSSEQHRYVLALPGDPVQLCAAAQRLIILPPSASADDLSPQRLAERNIRPARVILDAALQRDGRPLDQQRARKDRVTGTCRHFAVLSCSFLQARGFAARARCGFARYFETGRAVDHWVTEYRDDDHERWVRIDSEILGLEVIDNPHDLNPSQFLAGPEAWSQYRKGTDPSTFGVGGTDNWGVAEIIGNAIRDLASLNHVEMLPWDEWGPMRECYDGNIEGWVEQLMDEFVATGKDEHDLAGLYDRVRVPQAMIG